MRKDKIKLVFAIILFLSVGYAVLASNLSLSNVVKISKSSFDVHFDIVEVADTTLENPTYTINSDNNQVTFNASFDKPGDYVDYSVRVLNAGTIDAELNSFQVTGINNSNVNYSLKYYDGSSLAKGDSLRAGSTKRIVFRLEYNYDINELEEIPDISATVSLSYIQQENVNENVWDFNYQEEVQTFIANKAGKYKIEAWGAQGGTATSSTVNSNQGYGGYSVGTVNLSKDEPLYISVGEAGKSGEAINLAKTYNGGGSAPSTEVFGSFASSGGGGTFVFDSNSLVYATGSDLYNEKGDGNGNPVTPEQVYMSGNTLVINYPDNYNFYKGGNSKKRLVGEYYKVEYRGENLDDPRLEYCGGIYPLNSEYFFPNRGIEIYAMNISSDVAEIYYKMTEDNKTTEFRILTHGAFIKIHSKSVIKLDDPLIVAGGGGGAHIHWNGKSYAGSGGGYIGGSPVSISQHNPDECTPGSGGTQSQGGKIGVGFTNSGQNGNKGIGGSAKNTHFGSGGGGGFFGGASGLPGNACAYSASGGSGYIANSRLSSKEMYCFGCQESTDTDTKTTKTTDVSETPKSKNAKIGNGHVRITYLGN